MPKIPIAVKQNIKKKPQNVFVKIASFKEIPPIAFPLLVFLGLSFDPLDIFFHARYAYFIDNYSFLIKSEYFFSDDFTDPYSIVIFLINCIILI